MFYVIEKQQVLSTCSCGVNKHWKRMIDLLGNTGTPHSSAIKVFLSKTSPECSAAISSPWPSLIDYKCSGGLFSVEQRPKKLFLCGIKGWCMKGWCMKGWCTSLVVSWQDFSTHVLLPSIQPAIFHCALSPNCLLPRPSGNTQPYCSPHPSLASSDRSALTSTGPSRACRPHGAPSKLFLDVLKATSR